MARHVFLTGEKRIGKSTLLKKVLERYPGGAEGFRTVRTDAFLKDRYSVHMFAYGREMIPDESNLLFVCGEKKEHISERFDRLGCGILSGCTGCALLVMDELGPNEAGAAAFRSAVLRALDGETPIFGVLQAPCGVFWPELAAHPSVGILKITRENREDERLIGQILSLLGG